MSSEPTQRVDEGVRDMGGYRVDRQQIVDLDFLRGLIAAVDESGIDSLEVSRGGTRIRIAKSPTPAATVIGAPNHLPPTMPGSIGGGHGPPAAGPAPGAVGPVASEPDAAAVAPADNLVEVTSPMVGTFYRAPAPEAPAYVEVGSRIVKGQTLCILEAMKLMNELEAEVSGVVREICVDNSEPVEYGQVLFRIEPEA
jgi:acetyl-CoA carboxylase biotin carboxyl carrier protein